MNPETFEGAGIRPTRGPSAMGGYGYGNEQYPQAAYDGQTPMPMQGYPPQEGYPEGYPPQEGYPQGYPPQEGYPQEGYPPQGDWQQQGYPPQEGYPPQGDWQQQQQQGYDPAAYPPYYGQYPPPGQEGNIGAHASHGY